MDEGTRPPAQVPTSSTNDDDLAAAAGITAETPVSPEIPVSAETPAPTETSVSAEIPTFAEDPTLAEVPETAQEEKKHYSLLNFIIELPILIAIAFLIAFLVKTFVVQPFYIPSGSMEPTLVPKDRVLVNKFIGRFEPYERGEVLVFISPIDGQKDFIKRVIGLPGETVEVKEGKVRINGKVINEPYLPDGLLSGGDYGPYKVERGHYFMMGDNRNNSQDSRVFGAVEEDDILGKAFVIYWPIEHIHLLSGAN